MAIAAAGAQEPAPDVHAAAAVRPEYKRLLGALDTYRQIASAGGWPTVPAGPTIRPGTRDPRVAVLAERLAVTGDLEAPRFRVADYDDELQLAVRRFQSRHGLEPDALVGPATLRALNVTAGERVNQLELNLPRARDVFRSKQSGTPAASPASQAQIVRRDSSRSKYAKWDTPSPTSANRRIDSVRRGPTSIDGVGTM